MADIFDQISPSTGDIFDEISPNMQNALQNNAKAPANEQPVTIQNPGSHPTYSAPEYNFNPVAAVARGANTGIVNTAETIGGAIAKGFGATPEARQAASKETTNKFGGNVLGIKPSMPGTAANVSENLASSAIQSAPGLAASAVVGPVAGFGLSGALRGYAEDKNPLAEGAKDALFTKLFMVAGGAGGEAFVSSAKKLGIPENVASAEFLRRAGNTLGAGGVSGVQSGGDPTSIVQGAALGAAFPSSKPSMSDLNPINQRFYTGQPAELNPEQHDAFIQKEGAPIYRNIFNPGKGIINKVEVKGGGDINDSMALAAKMALPVAKSEGKLDNTKAIDIVKAAPVNLYNQQNEILSSNPIKQFNLEQLGDQVKKQLADTTKSASDLQTAKAKVDNEINAEILRHGPDVDGQTLNMIKQGMWSKSYNPLEPNANDTARAIGYAAKDAIEQAYPNDAIRQNNAQIGQYLQLQRILEATHGQVVQAGKLGGYAASAVGALAGHALHIPGAEIAGGFIGGKTSEYINDPARITDAWAKKLGSVKIVGQQPITPEVMPRQADSQKPILGITEQNQTALPSPRDVAYSPSQHTEMSGSIKIPNSSSGEPIEVAPIARRNRAVFTPGAEKSVVPFSQFGELAGEQKPVIKTPEPGTPEHSETFPHSQFNPLKDVQESSNPIKDKVNSEKGQVDTKSNLANIAGSVVAAGMLGIGSVFNPVNAQAKTVQDKDRLNLSAAQYTMKNEGFKPNMYLDGNGFKTVGYGFKENGMAWKYIPLAVKQGRRAMTKEEAQTIFNKSYPAAVVSAQKFAGPTWNNLSENQKKVLTDMSYQMGSIQFPAMKRAVRAGHFNTAAKEILDSKYAREDSPERALQNSVLIQQ